MTTLAELPDMHIALDGEDEPTLWLRRPRHPFGDKALVRRCDVDVLAWSLIVVAIEEFERRSGPFTCPTCTARVIDTDPHSDAYEAEVARHMDGVCFGAGGAA